MSVQNLPSRDVFRLESITVQGCYVKRRVLKTTSVYWSYFNRSYFYKKAQKASNVFANSDMSIFFT